MASIKTNTTPITLMGTCICTATGSPSLQFVLSIALRDLHIWGFVWELLDWVIYKTLYGNPLDFSKIYDIVMNDKMKLTYILFSMHLSVLCNVM